MQFREWMEHSRAKFLFLRILKGLFPNGHYSAGDRSVFYSVSLGKLNRHINFALNQNKQDASNEPYVEISFEFENTPDFDDLQSDKLETGTMEFMHLFRKVVAALKSVGLGIKYSPLQSEKDVARGNINQRDRIYSKVLTKAGFEPSNSSSFERGSTYGFKAFRPPVRAI